MITMTGLRWVVFDEDGGACALASDEALVRWAQARGYRDVSAWRADPGTHTMQPCYGQRQGVTWTITLPREQSDLEPDELVHVSGTEASWNVPADPSDDPRVLRIVETIETAAAASVLEPVRWTLSEWPPDELHADSDPNQIGQKLGSVYDIGVGPGGAITRYWHYCPDRVALVAEQLDDDDLTKLLDYLEGRVSLTMVNERLEPHERERFIDQTFLEPNPELQQMLTGLLLRAMDLSL